MDKSGQTLQNVDTLQRTDGQKAYPPMATPATAVLQCLFGQVGVLFHRHTSFFVLVLVFYCLFNRHTEFFLLRIVFSFLFI